MRIQVLGLCRFSLLTQGDFQTTGDDLDRNRAILYDPARMEQRMRWFEAVCIPPLMWQTDPDFLLIIVTGEDLPARWLARLQRLAQVMPQIRIEQLPPARHAPSCREALARHIDLTADVVVQFRMDDDDAVAVDYVRRVRADHRLAERLAGQHHPVVINYTSGLVAEVADGRFALHAEMAQNWVPAQTIAMPGRAMWIRGHHATNDSRGHLIGRNRIPTDEAELAQVLSRRFGLDLPALRAALTGTADPLA